jgi:hypothetical protein
MAPKPPRDVKLEVPGGQTSTPVETAVETPAAAASDAALTPQQDSDLRSQLIETAKLVGDGKALDWSSLNQSEAIAKGGKLDPDAGLPESADAATITEPVLTRNGWVLPINDPRARFGQR